MIFKLLTLIGYFIFRPALVKQKHSIQVITKSTKSKVLKVSSQAFNFPDNHAIAQHHFKELGRELSGRGDGPVGKQPANASLQANIEIEVTFHTNDPIKCSIIPSNLCRLQKLLFLIRVVKV